LTDGKWLGRGKTKILITICSAIMLLCTGYARAGVWITLDYPGATITEAYDISGSNVVGWYMDSLGIHGFLYDGTTWTTLNYPGAAVTIINGISGSNVVGVYQDSSGEHGFLYNGTTWTTLDYPGAAATEARGISGSNIVGVYGHGGLEKHGFLYNGTTWTELYYPGANGNTYANGISGNKVVGGYYDSSGNGHGFLYDGTTWTTLDYPGALLATETYGINNSRIVGRYKDSEGLHGLHGFLYNGTTWTTLDYPGASNTYANGVSGSNIVGSYEDPNFRLHGFFFCSEPILGDLNGDCKVDFQDFAILASDWLKNSSNVNVPSVKITLDSDPGWTIEGQWQFGTPMGMGGSSHGYPDPNAAYTGLNVYGVNLNGDYALAVGGPYRLTAGPFDCNSYESVELSFARWLNTDTENYVQCKVEASNDGSTWQTVWLNPTSVPITDNQWLVVQYDITQIAAGHSQVYVRWSYQIISDRAYPYSGWNIDDVELLGID
jgi:hypothetical protein